MSDFTDTFCPKEEFKPFQGWVWVTPSSRRLLHTGPAASVTSHTVPSSVRRSPHSVPGPACARM